MSKLTIPAWAQNRPGDTLQYLCHFAALQFGDSGMAAWADASGINVRTIYHSIKRGGFTPKAAQKLVDVIPGQPLKQCWLVSPDSVVIDRNGVVIYE